MTDGKESRVRASTLIFDGDCGICTRSAQICESMDLRRRFRIVAFQKLTDDQLARFGLSAQECLGEVKVVDPNGRIRGGAFAVNYFLFKNPPWTVLIVLLYLIPILLLFEVIVYKAVARNRSLISRWLGLTDCKVTPNMTHVDH